MDYRGHGGTVVSPGSQLWDFMSVILKKINKIKFILSACDITRRSKSCDTTSQISSNDKVVYLLYFCVHLYLLWRMLANTAVM